MRFPEPNAGVGVGYGVREGRFEEGVGFDDMMRSKAAKRREDVLFQKPLRTEGCDQRLDDGKAARVGSP